MNEQQKIKAVVVGAVLLLILGAGYVFCVSDPDRGTVPEVNVYQQEAGRNIRDARERAESVSENIERAEEGTSRVSDGITRSQERVEQLQKSNGRIKGLVEESRGLAKESRTILKGLPKVDDK